MIQLLFDLQVMNYNVVALVSPLILTTFDGLL